MAMFDPKDLAAAAGPAPEPDADQAGGPPDADQDDLTCPTCGASAAKILAGGGSPAPAGPNGMP